MLAGSVVLGLLLPLGRLDAAGHEASLALLAHRAPPGAAIAVSATLAELRDGACSARLVELTTPSRGVVLAPPTATFCLPRDASVDGALDRVHTLPPSSLLTGPRGHLVGLGPTTGPGGPLAGATGGWVVGSRRADVPSFRLADFAAGRVSRSALSGRFVVVGVGDDLGSGRVDPAEVASVLGGALDGGRRTTAPAWASVALVAGVVGAIELAHRRFARSRLALALLALMALLFGLQLALASWFVPSLLALGRAAVASLVASLGLWALDDVAQRRAMVVARAMTERAALFHARALSRLTDHEFFSKLGDLALQAHPADFVLVAELPARRWHLKFWSRPGADASLIAEPRRDVRRVPFTDDDGVPTARVIEGFLVAKETPVVVVPLQALGQLEGYIFLCGERAKRAFLTDRHAAARLSKDLGLLVRARRGDAEDEGRSIASAASRAAGSAASASRLALAAEAAFRSLQLFSDILRDAPVPLLYADSFAEVRLVSRSMAAWLRKFEVQVPSSEVDTRLPEGLLSLRSVIVAFTGESQDAAAHVLSEVLARDEPLRLWAGPEGLRCRVSIQAVRREDDALRAVRGYVLSLEPKVSPARRAAPGDDALPDRSPPSNSFAPTRRVGDLGDDAERA